MLSGLQNVKGLSVIRTEKVFDLYEVFEVQENKVKVIKVTVVSRIIAFNLILFMIIYLR
jgi:hypothetical protein